MLAIVEFQRVRYVRQPFRREPDFDVTASTTTSTSSWSARRSLGQGGSRSMARFGRHPTSEGEPRRIGGKKKRPLRGVGPVMLSLAGCREL